MPIGAAWRADVDVERLNRTVWRAATGVAMPIGAAWRADVDVERLNRTAWRVAIGVNGAQALAWRGVVRRRIGHVAKW